MPNHVRDPYDLLNYGHRLIKILGQRGKSGDHIAGIIMAVINNGYTGRHDVIDAAHKVLACGRKRVSDRLDKEAKKGFADRRWHLNGTQYCLPADIFIPM